MKRGFKLFQEGQWRKALSSSVHLWDGAKTIFHRGSMRGMHLFMMGDNRNYSALTVVSGGLYLWSGSWENWLWFGSVVKILKVILVLSVMLKIFVGTVCLKQSNKELP